MYRRKGVKTTSTRMAKVVLTKSPEARGPAAWYSAQTADARLSREAHGTERWAESIVREPCESRMHATVPNTDAEGGDVEVADKTREASRNGLRRWLQVADRRPYRVVIRPAFLGL